nr:venom protein U-MPTX.8-20 [Megalopyge opercularis]
MKTIYLLVVLLPTAIIGELRIKINVKDDPKNAEVILSGSDESPISEKEREAFGITDIKLKKVIEKINKGHRPNDVYVRSHTEHGNLFKRFNWPPMNRLLTPVSARVIDYQKVVTSVTGVKYNNPSDKNITHNIDVTKEISNEVTNKWSSSHTLGAGVSVSVDFVFGSAGLDMSYSHTWGKEEAVSEIGSMTIVSSAEVKLWPKEGVSLYMNASKNFLHLEITYKSVLTGSVAANYAEKYDNHYFYHYFYPELRRAEPRLPEHIITKQISIIEFTSEVEVFAKSIGEKRKKTS